MNNKNVDIELNAQDAFLDKELWNDIYIWSQNIAIDHIDIKCMCWQWIVIISGILSSLKLLQALT